MIVLGIVAKKTRFGFPIKNGSATLLDGSKLLVSIPEERLTQTKSSPGCKQATDFILNTVLRGDAPDRVVISSCCEHAEDAYSEELGNTLFLQKKIECSSSHHFSHALMAYYLSPFDRALVIVIDAGGSTFGRTKDPRWWTLPREQASFYLAQGNSIELVSKCFFAPFEWGIGEAYRAFTQYLGFGGQTNSGKTMGLASFARDHHRNIPLFELMSEGQVRSNLKCETPWKADDGVRAFLRSNGIDLDKREANGPLLPVHATIANIVQSDTEGAIMHIAKHLLKKHGLRNICLAGGVALNIPTNTMLLNIDHVEGVFIPPCPGDDGQSIGNAMFPLFNTHGRNKPSVEWSSAFLGAEQSFAFDRIRRDLSLDDGNFDIIDDDDNYSVAADLLSNGHILGWFHGRSEVGPRALGHRSILADPRRFGVRRRISLWVKGRDPFRPYAASVLVEDVDEWFQLKTENPFMLFLGGMRHHTKMCAPALFHPDGNCRIHTVDGRVYELRSLLKSFKKKTGLPFVLNTSLNLIGRPIVETPVDAIEALKGSDMDGLVIGSKIIMKRRRTIPAYFVKVPEIAFEFGDKGAEEQLKLLYPGMPIARRSYFGLVHEYCDWVLTGRKSTTVRYANQSVDLPMDKFLQVIAQPGGEIVYAVEIKRIRILPYGSLSHQDALRDGFSSLAELKDALTRFYGNISELDPVTIYEIEVMPGFDGVRERALISPHSAK